MVKKQLCSLPSALSHWGVALAGAVGTALTEQLLQAAWLAALSLCSSPWSEGMWSYSVCALTLCRTVGVETCVLWLHLCLHCKLPTFSPADLMPALEAGRAQREPSWACLGLPT